MSHQKEVAYTNYSDVLQNIGCNLYRNDLSRDTTMKQTLPTAAWLYIFCVF